MRGMSPEDSSRQSGSQENSARGGWTHPPSKRRVRLDRAKLDEDAARELGETSDEYGPEGRNDAREMTPGDEIAMTNPDVQQIGPSSEGSRGAAYERGFGDDSTRRD